MAPTIPAPHMKIQLEPLTQSSFAPFGTVVTAPLPQSRTTIPYPPPQSSNYANQGTALKYPDITPLTSEYRLSPSGAPAQPHISLFACFPRALRKYPTIPAQQLLDVRILERHPFTTQSFVPLAPHAAEKKSNSKYIVIVAPTLPSPDLGIGLTPYFPQFSSQGLSSAGGLPDLGNTRAFVADETMGVTYHVGVWHAPMAVIYDNRIDFLVTQWMSGKEGEDCQEVDLGAREGEGIEVVVPETDALKSKL